MQQSTCLSPFCGTQTPYTVPACPACGRPAFDDEELARRGRHVLQLGVILAPVMAAVIWMLAANLAAALDGRPSRHPAASAENARLVIVSLGAMLLMGLALIVSGIKMIRGRSSLWSTRLAIILFVSALLAIGAFIVRAYARVHARLNALDAPLPPERILPAMIDRFIAGDREFSKQRRRAQ